MSEREMLQVTKCVRVNSFVGALINELKITSGSKFLFCKNLMVIQHCIKELLSKNSVTRL